eukprot:GAHX01000502.1.p1 GENE.GAHX01000502.1~~GAHX01000502.1.p1  ORF type:complete len:1003 (+),score=207.24 GAHX01000502.1:37-3009(+)
MDNSFSKDVSEISTYFSSDTTKGLTIDKVLENRVLYGGNEMPEGKTRSFISIFISQFEDLMIFILLLSALVSFILSYLETQSFQPSSFIEPGVILLIVFINAIIGAIQESKAEKSIQNLKEFETSKASVMREGETIKIDSSELVCGDLVKIAAGMKIPADCRVVEIESGSLAIDESLLTGETKPVEKNNRTMKLTKKQTLDIVAQDKCNEVFAGSLVVRGSARVMVARVGHKTELGKVKSSLLEENTLKTPLQAKLDEFAQQLSKGVLFTCLFVWAINIKHFSDPEFKGNFLKGSIHYFKMAVALAVAAIPEGLPAVVTTCLGLGAQRMAKKKALVRNLPSAETLGCTSVICSDKTGTLTTNKMAVKYFVVNNKANKLVGIHMEGNDYSFDNLETSEYKTTNSYLEANKDRITFTSEMASLCNDAKLEIKKGKVALGIGEPTEAALKTMHEKVYLRFNERFSNTMFPGEEILNTKYRKLTTQEFNRERKSMSVLAETIVTGRKKSENLLMVKGAPEEIIERCSSLTDNAKEKILAQINEDFMSTGLRCIAFAYRNVSDKEKDDIIKLSFGGMATSKDFGKLETGLTFTGLAAMQDPPRPGIKESLEKCREAGIRVVVLTGDNKVTATSISKQIGLVNKEISSEIMNGTEFFKSKVINGKESLVVNHGKDINQIKLLSRVEPKHKFELVKLLQQQNYVVAMTGDGVNDAPALKRSDIGIAVGSGTEVAREASDMVLLNDNFNSIVDAVEEGRLIYNNMKLFVRYLISSNIGEVLIIFLANLLGLPSIFKPIQLLWVNLVTDGLPATALSFNKKTPRLMKEKPRKRNESLVGRKELFRFLLVGVYIGIATVGIYIDHFRTKGYDLNSLQKHFSCSESNQEGVCAEISKNTANTLSLSVLVTIEMFNAFNALSDTESLFSVGIFANWFLVFSVFISMGLHFLILHNATLQAVFGLVPLSLDQWKRVIVFSFPVVLIEEVFKYFMRKEKNKISK